MHFYEVTTPADLKELKDALAPFLTFLSNEEDIPVDHVAKKLHYHVNRFGVDEVEVIKSAHVEDGDMNLNASYDPYDDEEGLDPFRMELIFSPGTDTITFSEEGIENIKHRILDALEHEMIHMQQYRKRNYVKQKGYDYKTKDERLKRTKQYLGNDDEIEAFAKNIASELIRKADKDGAMELLKMANRTAQFKDEAGYLLSPNLFGYLAAWNFDTKHPVIKKLLKKVFFYIENA